MSSPAIWLNSSNNLAENIPKEEISQFDLQESFIKDEPDEEILYDELERKLKVRCGDVFALLGERLILACTFCDENFSDMQLLGGHLFVKHTDKFFMKEDNIQPTLSTIKKESADHVTTNGTVEGISHSKCPENVQQNLKYTCDICGISYKYRINLLRHQRKRECKKYRNVIHPIKDDLSKGSCWTSHGYKCDKCGVCYKNRRNLVRHAKKSCCNQANAESPESEIELSRENTETSTLSIAHPVSDDLSKGSSSTPNRYKCDICGVSYKNRRNLVRHAMKVRCDQAHKAESPKSNVKLSRKNSETSSLNISRPGSDSIEAEIDNHQYMDTFPDVLILEQSDRDSRCTTPERSNYSCHTCNLTFYEEAQLKCHLQIHMACKDPELYCTSCERQFESKKALSNHQRLHRQLFRTKEQVSESADAIDTNIPKNPALFCNLCDQFFRNKNQLYVHADSHESIPSVLENDDEFLKCKYCWTEFSKYKERKAHEATHTGPRPFECPYCHKGFASNLSRKSHFRVHTGESPHQCDQCKKVFRDKHDLHRHIQRHLNIRNVDCELCEKKFFNKHQLMLHMRTHTKERPYVCEDCGKTFPFLPQLKDHQLRHTGIKNVKCEVCGRLFYSNSVLKVHMASHSDEKPFECTVCGRRFSRAKAMQKHLKLHSGIKKYVCNICGKAYAQDSGLYAHKKTHARQF